MIPIINVHVKQVERLISPAELQRLLPITDKTYRTVIEAREIIQAILAGEDNRFLVVVGPCSIHDPKGAIEYAKRLKEIRKEVEKELFIVMRTYFEKPRTTVGWKGLINDPELDGSCDIEKGLKIARTILLEIVGMGIPTATEFLDSTTPQYISDLVCWAAIGARTIESQYHREMASGLSMPVGFKNGTDGSLQIALDALGAAMYPHSFLGIDEQGMTSIIRTTGNRWGHVILRGGRTRTNYDPESIEDAVRRLKEAGLPPRLMIDCSHANCGKQHNIQKTVWYSILGQRIKGNLNIIGAMLESYLYEGNQKIPADLSQLKYGVSITDPCIGWEMTETLLWEGSRMLEENKLALQ
ncbi:3-deoxy-7-phosphoheptulonate synthase [Candidatus Methylacidiphilum fumarolicum]|uniref:Phospho-2-dehydro-3-deoxyheptonate aldolase n=2 Tax=Candidatus Methylacidiphilum fumarolicum TaxID=591154 RepID=I0JY78_METFB|nr:3-deoxy-7-phosphoheptulonate synthase [Candidatus Methylacidiphilum fumarolicum]MBW6415938.1 3-deoxy-7-phosphoheptulonate synthase [Candidatus Methylacidiphilum fumarolicum]TFE69124.1 3-deoxy-7-phosphoheptulonate synthase [Candidatus Methylacidiphilum fumarolicum]TFE71460.1 3-deoxy-7-phosphoheptulonate synthase [Candidatus Methylacidiphilum fumarolicum]TFE72141.1 3-deoxy-7-phosphoheptulonate synthase [Candidatus Methylacidiphilum fumarolicum]TFE77357.1 3-deoxy-7-phosphoheptulonate synthase 